MTPDAALPARYAGSRGVRQRGQMVAAVREPERRPGSRPADSPAILGYASRPPGL